MLSYHRAIRDAARRLSDAALTTVVRLNDGRVEQEPAFTDRMLAAMERAMEGYAAKGLRWSAKTLTDRGRNAQEREFGADFLAVLEIETWNYNLRKGFLAQAKLVEPGGSFSKNEYQRLSDQCIRMLDISPDAFVFLYSTGGITVVPAISVVASAPVNPHSLYKRHLARFYEEHFASFIGDGRLSRAHIDTLRTLAERSGAPRAIEIRAEDRGAA